MNKNKIKKVMNNKISITKVIYSKNKNKILQISRDKDKDSESISFIIVHLCLTAINIIKKNQDKQETT